MLTPAGSLWSANPNLPLRKGDRLRLFQYFGSPSQHELPDRTPVPLIWMLGKTGSGKTSIIRFITGSDDAEIGSGYRPETKHSREFCFPDDQDTLVRFLDTPGLGEAGYDATDDLQLFGQKADLILITVRLTDQATQSLLRSLGTIRKSNPHRPVVLVVTAIHDACPGTTEFDTRLLDDLHSDAMPEQIRRPLRAQLERFAGLYDHAVAVDLTRPEDGFEPTDLGGDRLFEVIMESMPAAMRLTMTTMRRLQSDLHQNSSSKSEIMILTHATLAAGAAAVPIAWIDMPVVLGIQTHLAHRVARRHGQTLTPVAVAQLSVVLGGRAAIRMALKGFAKLIPVIGSAINSAAAFCLIYASGKVLDWYFSQVASGQMPSQDEIAKVYQQQIDAARQYWKSRRLGDPEPENPSGKRA